MSRSGFIGVFVIHDTISSSPIGPQQKVWASNDMGRRHYRHMAEGLIFGNKLGTLASTRNIWLEDVGRCVFDRKAQIDNCEMKLMHSDGSILVGTTESRYSFDAHKTLKMIVTPKMAG